MSFAVIGVRSFSMRHVGRRCAHLSVFARVLLVETRKRGEVLADTIFLRAEGVVAGQADPWAAITADGGLLTAIGNDYAFQDVFSRQVRAYGKQGDVLIALSSSGKSRNILSAIEEARIVLDDVKATLAAAGMSMDDLVSVQVFCSDVAHFDVFNRVYRGYFTREFPARAFIGSGPLLFGARFEVQAVAVKR